jgi:hypothetical protein
MAGYPKSGNLIPKALLRIFKPVAAAISSRVGLLEASPLTELSEPLRFNPFWTLSEITIILIAFYRRFQAIFKEVIVYVGFGYGLSRIKNEISEKAQKSLIKRVERGFFRALKMSLSYCTPLEIMPRWNF